MNANSNIDDPLELIASTVLKQQGIAFSSLTEAQNHSKRIKNEIIHVVAQGNKTLIEGLKQLTANNQGHVHGYVAGVCAKLLKHIRSSKKIKKIIDADITANESALLLFAGAAENFIDNGDLEKEHAVLTVLMALFPLNPQPYLYFGASVWRTDGVDAAAAFYTEVIKVLPNPAIYYVAADCFYKKGDKDSARELVNLALDHAQKSPELYGHIEKLAAEFIQRF